MKPSDPMKTSAPPENMDTIPMSVPKGQNDVLFAKSVPNRASDPRVTSE
jgi:hypothetical protein